MIFKGNHTMRKYYFWVIFFAVVIFGGTFSFRMLRNHIEAKAYSDRETRPVISTVMVNKTTYQPMLSSVGSMTAVQGVDVTSQINGQIVSIPFRSGQDVKEGDILVQLDNRLALQAYQMDQATLAYDKVNYDSQRQLLATDATNKNAVDQAEATYLAQKALTEKDKINLDDTTIKAPFSGRLGIRQVDIGQYITTSTVLASLQQLDPMLVDFAMSGAQVTQLYKGQPIKLTVSSQQSKVFEGKIIAIDSAVNEATRTINVRASVDNKDETLLPGQFANVSIILPTQENVLTVPRTAIAYSLYGNAVYVVTSKQSSDSKKQYIVTEKYVTVGETDGDNVIITKGLNEGDQVVSSGQNKVTSGQEVLIDNDIKLS